jgi:hypothetical protein
MPLSAIFHLYHGDQLIKFSMKIYLNNISVKFENRKCSTSIMSAIYVPAGSRNIAKNGKSDDKLEPSESSENHSRYPTNNKFVG